MEWALDTPDFHLSAGHGELLLRTSPSMKSISSSGRSMGPRACRNFIPGETGTTTACSGRKMFGEMVTCQTILRGDTVRRTERKRNRGEIRGQESHEKGGYVDGRKEGDSFIKDNLGRPSQLSLSILTSLVPTKPTDERRVSSPRSPLVFPLTPLTGLQL